MRRLCRLLCALVCVMGWVLWKQETNAPAVSAQSPLQTDSVAAAVSPDRIRVEAVQEKEQEENPQEASEESVMLRVYEEGIIREVEMEEYLVHVVAGEMPASYEPEALRAQAVAARSYIAWKMPVFGGSGCSRGGDVCTDSEHCMAYRSEAELREKWGEDYESYRVKIAQAVQDTVGEVMAYNGSPIQALFHSSSGGWTEDAQAVWGTAFPYLQSVESSGEDDTRKEKRFPAAQLVKQLNAAFDGAGLTESTVKAQFVVRTRTASGRADVVKVGKVTATGKAVRAALDLSSANFTVEWDGDEAVLTTIGYGHGVGMSQVGANAMAEQGSGYQEILTHYYIGVEVVQMQALGA